MEQYKIDRINELAHKVKSGGTLTPQEEQERAALRREYIDSFKRSLTSQLEHTYIEYPDGSRKKLEKKSAGKA